MQASAVTFMRVCKKIHQAISKNGMTLHVNRGNLEAWDVYTNTCSTILCSRDDIHQLLHSYTLDITFAAIDIQSHSIVHKCTAEVFLQEVEGGLLE